MIKDAMIKNQFFQNNVRMFEFSLFDRMMSELANVFGTCCTLLEIKSTVGYIYFGYPFDKQ